MYPVDRPHSQPIRVALNRVRCCQAKTCGMVETQEAANHPGETSSSVLSEDDGITEDPLAVSNTQSDEPTEDAGVTEPEVEASV